MLKNILKYPFEVTKFFVEPNITQSTIKQPNIGEELIPHISKIKNIDFDIYTLIFLNICLVEIRRSMLF